MIKRYRKTAIVEAVELKSFNDVDLAPVVIEFCPIPNWVRYQGAVTFGVTLKTLEGELQVFPPCYIVKGVNGEFWPVSKEIFEKTYEELTGNKEV